jgi:GTP pyrophosphokinase
MKSNSSGPAPPLAPEPGDGVRPDGLPQLIAATSQAEPGQADALARARAFAEPLLIGETLETGENTLAHADAVAAILNALGSSETMQAAAYLVYTCNHLNKPEEVIGKAFGSNFAALAVETTKLMRVQTQAREAQVAGLQVDDAATQNENVRKMLLAFSRDLRVVMLRLASRLQTLRYYAASKRPVSPAIAREAQQVFAPLANRLGIWQMKWELEDLAFRFLEPDTYREVARLLDEKRVERELYMEQLRARLESELRAHSISASVSGRPKHIYSIVKKMRGKSLNFDQVFDIRALRVIVPNVKDCYAALSWVHSQFSPIEAEFDDYIAKPKPNGYQSLHTVVRDEAGRAIEIQIRTQAMHDHAEHGVAAHWAYKEAGTKGYAGVSAASEYDAKIAVLRQLLAWERDLVGSASRSSLFEDRIYVLTPDAAVVELPQGATPVDFAYAVHTNVGHRCRGARVDGAMVPLNTPLQNGQTVEISTVKEGRPSRDWLNPELGYLVSHRAKAKVRAWFNAQATAVTVAARARTGGKAAAARGQDGPQARRPGRTIGLQDGRRAVRDGGQGRALAALHRNPVAPARARCANARHAGAQGARQRRRRQGRGAGGGRGFAHDAAGQMLQARAAGRYPRLCHARQGRERAPQRLPQLPRNVCTQRRARDRRAVGQTAAPGRGRCGLSRGRGRGGRGSPGAAA